MSRSTKILFIDTGFLTMLFNKEHLDFRWDRLIDKDVHGFDRVAAYIPEPVGKHAFVKYVTARNITVNSDGILMPEFLLQTHIRAMYDAPLRYEYVIIGHSMRLVQVLHPMLDISANDVMTLHHSHERSLVQTWIDESPKNVFWHGVDCLDKYFKKAWK